MSINTIEARREARRRKILENAESRLTKISGNHASNESTEHNVHITENGMNMKSSPEIISVTYQINTSSSKDLLIKEKERPQNHTTNDELHLLNQNINHLLKNIQSTSEKLMLDKNVEATSATPSKSSKFMLQISYFCLGILVRILFELNLGFFITDMYYGLDIHPGFTCYM
uniref:Uncharacterized protein n=1 Tax=Clastoptera arizonana TaxID=38151 RepID=A0A1B6DTE0_9HEMI